MNLRAQRKLNWLQKTGGDEAIEALGAFVEKASEFATINNIPYKEQGEDTNMNEDVLDNATLDIDEMSKEDIVENSAEVDAISSLAESEVETETVEKEETVETDEVVEEVVEEVETVEAPETNVEKEDRPITFKELSETIDTFVNDVFSPLMEVVKELRDTNVELTNRINALESNSATLKEVKEDLEIVPTASVASLIKERIVNRLDGLVVTKESIADETLTEQKPIENVSKNTDEHLFADFASGL